MDYIKFGTGSKSFVILPGLSVHSIMKFAEAVQQRYAAFTEDYTIYVFDREKNIQDGYTVRDMSDDTAAAMKKLQIKNADIFGASQGGMIALYLAIDHPDLVSHLVLGSTLAKNNDTFYQVIDEWIHLAEKKDETGLLESFSAKVYSKATLDAYKDTIISLNQGITDEEYERFIILASACKSFNCYDELSSIKAPVMAIGAKGDRVTTAEGSRQIAKALACDLYLYDENYGHGVYDEASDYTERCKRFFEKE